MMLLYLIIHILLKGEQVILKPASPSDADGIVWYSRTVRETSDLPPPSGGHDLSVVLHRAFKMFRLNSS